MKIRSTLFRIVLPLIGLGAMTLVQADVVVESPWVREAPPTAKMLAGYMVLHNQGDAVQVLDGASAVGFDEVEIHKTTIHDGIASMQAQDSLSIPPQDSVKLAPGGYHLMLMQGAQPLKEGDTVAISLKFKDGKTLEVQAPVRKDPTAPESHGDGEKEHHEHHEHHHQD
jgi:hypothetical protein